MGSLTSTLLSEQTHIQKTAVWLNNGFFQGSICCPDLFKQFLSARFCKGANDNDQAGQDQHHGEYR